MGEITMHTALVNSHEAIAPDSGNRAVAAVRRNGFQPRGGGYAHGDGFFLSKFASQEFSAGGTLFSGAPFLIFTPGLENGRNGLGAQYGGTTNPHHVSPVVQATAAAADYQGNFSLGFSKPQKMQIYAQYPSTEQCYSNYSTCGSEAAFQGRFVLPLSIASDGGPIYVNAKQYNGIMRRRKSRAKAEMQNKVMKRRKPYLHLSRHLHAMRRPRGTGGRFLNTKGSKAIMEKANKEGINQAPCSIESQASEVLQYSDGGGMIIHRATSLGSEVASHLFSGNAPFHSFHNVTNTGLGITTAAAAVAGNYLKV